MTGAPPGTDSGAPARPGGLGWRHPADPQPADHPAPPSGSPGVTQRVTRRHIADLRICGYADLRHQPAITARPELTREIHDFQHDVTVICEIWFGLIYQNRLIVVLTAVCRPKF